MFPDLKEIKRLREKIGWSQLELANKCGISQSAITKYEKGLQVPSYDIAIRIFEELISEDRQNDIKVTDIMTENVIYAKNTDKYQDILSIIKKHGVSQLPVIKHGRVVGSISESSTLNLIDKYYSLSELKEEIVENFMEEMLPTVPRSARIREITPLLRRYYAIIVVDKGNILGIITKADLIMT
jgi:predicted transcriptional regulator